LDTCPRNFFLGFAQAAGRITETAEGSATAMPQTGTIEYILAASMKIQLQLRKINENIGVILTTCAHKQWKWRLTQILCTEGIPMPAAVPRKVWV